MPIIGDSPSPHRSATACRPAAVTPNRLVGPIDGARDRRVTLLAVHHVCVGGRTYTGGAEKYIQTAIRALLDSGARVHVGYSGTSIYDELLESHHPRRLSVENTGWLDAALSGDARLGLGVIMERRRWLRATRADTVFAVQQAGGGAFVASLLAARTLGLRVVATLRQSPEPLPELTARRALGLVPVPRFWHQRLIWRKRLPAAMCHALLYNSERVAEAYESTYGFSRSKRHVIPNGEFNYDDEPSRTAGMPMRIASVGRVTEAKGADLLFDAFTMVARRHPEARLTYFGDGDLIGKLSAKAVEHGLKDRVSFRGYVSSRPEIFRSMDICVQPSRRESMSNAVIEAMARGIPCVVADVGGMREAVIDGECGYVVPRQNSEACAEAICRILANREGYARLSQAARARARKVFDLQALMSKTVHAILGV